MKKPLKILLIIFSVILGVIIIGSVCISAYTGHQVVITSNQMAETDGSRRLPEEFYESCGFDYDAFIKEYNIDSFTVTSSLDGHVIPVDHIASAGGGTADVRGVVVMVHGLGGNKFTVYPTARVFLDNGYDVLCYDQRSSGENTAPYTTYGYLEKYDLIDCIDYLKKDHPDIKIGLWGVSMGGATVCSALGYGDTAKSIEFAVLDCPLGSMEKEIEIFLEENDMGIPIDYMLWCGNIMNGIEMGYKYDDVEAARNISGADVPLLVLNSEADQLTPYYMGKDIYDSSPSANKTLYTVKDSGHADIWVDHNEEYISEVEKLLRSVG